MRLRRALSLVAVLAGAAGCSGEDAQLERATLAIEASDNHDRHALVACEQLPLLQGSRRFTRHIIDDSLTITVTAVPSAVTLRFDENGLTLTKERTIPRGALLHDYVEDVDVLMYDGDVYKVDLYSGCTP